MNVQTSGLSFLSSWVLFFLFVLSNPNLLGFCLTLFYYYYPLETFCFLMKDRKGADLDGRRSGRELEGSEGEETVVRVSYVKETSILTKKN